MRHHIRGAENRRLSDLARNDSTHGTKNSTQRILGGILIEKTLHSELHIPDCVIELQSMVVRWLVLWQANRDQDWGWTLKKTPLLLAGTQSGAKAPNHGLKWDWGRLEFHVREPNDRDSTDDLESWAVLELLGARKAMSCSVPASQPGPQLGDLLDPAVSLVHCMQLILLLESLELLSLVQESSSRVDCECTAFLNCFLARHLSCDLAKMMVMKLRLLVLTVCLGHQGYLISGYLALAWQ
jgi:hypothetical protein